MLWIASEISHTDFHLKTPSQVGSPVMEICGAFGTEGIAGESEPPGAGPGDRCLPLVPC